MDVNNVKVEAAKRLKLRGVSYEPGDPVKTEGLPDHKIYQLLNQRFIRPVPTDT